MAARNPRTKVIPTWSEEQICAIHGYTILKKLGEGSFGVVYLCERKKDSNKGLAVLAAKVIDTTKANTRYVQKFLNREIEILLRIRYAEKGDLLEHLNVARTRGKIPIPEGQARLWSGQIGHALMFLHKKQIAHRDIKCENILITSHNNVKLSDFGFATRFDVKGGQPVNLTTYCGTPSYACPEILRSIPYNPEKADLWALGVVIYVMINGVLPFPAKNSSRILELQKNPVQMQKHLTISPELLEIFPKIFETNSKKRWEVHNFLDSDWFTKDPTFNLRPQIIKGKKYQPSKSESEIIANERQRQIELAKQNDEASAVQILHIKPFTSDSSAGSMGILIPFRDSVAIWKKKQPNDDTNADRTDEEKQKRKPPSRRAGPSGKPGTIVRSPNPQYTEEISPRTIPKLASQASRT